MTENLNLKNVRLKLLHKCEPVNLAIGLSALPAKSYERTVVCVKEKDKIYKIISLFANKKDESIYVVFPYCKDECVYISQFSHEYKSGEQIIPKSNTVREYILDLTTKLSIHKSGFVQLSGNNIRSGIDGETGIPKGIGVFSSSLDNPVSSGPTLGFQFWGIDKGFEELVICRKNVQYIVLEKEKNDFTERKFKKDKLINTYTLEFFIFPENANDFVYEYGNEPYIDHDVSNCLNISSTRVAHPVVDIKNFSGVICVFPVLTWTEFAEESEYGFVLGSPGGSMNINDDKKTGYNFFLICPRNNKFIPSEVNKLNYNSKES